MAMERVEKFYVDSHGVTTPCDPHDVVRDVVESLVDETVRATAASRVAAAFAPGGVGHAAVDRAISAALADLRDASIAYRVKDAIDDRTRVVADEILVRDDAELRERVRAEVAASLDRHVAESVDRVLGSARDKIVCEIKDKL